MPRIHSSRGFYYATSRNPKIAQYLKAYKLKITAYKNTCKLIENESGAIEKVTENADEVSEKVTENHIRVIEKVTEKANNLGDRLTENKLQILRLVLANPYITKQEMAKAVGVSVKSISIILPKI